MCVHRHTHTENEPQSGTKDKQLPRAGPASVHRADDRASVPSVISLVWAGAHTPVSSSSPPAESSPSEANHSVDRDLAT